ncbi:MULTISPECIES: phage major tail protein, TP901-1 family [Bacillaceae]|uniref:phage major tail protein, TP901-1 family n=1 Tax=Shouchella oshimensis TaxID=290588 RepID=UPI000A6924DF|nr:MULTISPECIES: phage major tail protein, TP901-1 family [Bacillaceae]
MNRNNVQTQTLQKGEITMTEQRLPFNLQFFAKEYKGEEFIFAVKDSQGLLRPFNQTGGSFNRSFDEIELDTKDKTGSDYGKESVEVSLEGVVTEGDPFIDYMDEKLDNKEFIEIYRVNSRKKTAKSGLYMITSWEQSYSNGEHATYTLSAKLNGKLKNEDMVETEAPAEEDQE